MITRSLLRRSLVGLAVFAATVLLGVVLAAGGDHGRSQPAPGRVTAANLLSARKGRPRAAGVVRPQPNRRDHKPRSASRRSAS